MVLVFDPLIVTALGVAATNEPVPETSILPSTVNGDTDVTVPLIVRLLNTKRVVTPALVIADDVVPVMETLISPAPLLASKSAVALLKLMQLPPLLPDMVIRYVPPALGGCNIDAALFKTNEFMETLWSKVTVCAAMTTSSPGPGTTPPAHVAVDDQFPVAVDVIVAAFNAGKAKKARIIAKARVIPFLRNLFRISGIYPAAESECFVLACFMETIL